MRPSILFHRRLLAILLFTLCVCPSLVWETGRLGAATIKEIVDANRPSIGGKEVDWIDGDYVLQNDQIIVVVAKPGKKRDANMTTRGVGASIIDLTRHDVPSDQLTAFYPAGGRYKFEDSTRVNFGKDDAGVFWRCESSATLSGNGTQCSVEYRLSDGDPFIEMTVTIRGEKAVEVKPADGVRADRTFKFAAIKGTTTAFCEDEYFCQTYGIQAIRGSKSPIWGGNRPKRITYFDAAVVSDDKQQLSWSTRVYPASSRIDLWGLTKGASPQTVLVRGAVGDQPRIKLTVVDGELGPLRENASWRCDDHGKTVVHLPAGKFRIRTEAIGHESTEHDVHVTDAAGTHELQLGSATRVAAKVTDGNGQPIPCKVSFYGAASDDDSKTKSPNFGIDSLFGSVGNTVYSADGEFVRSIPPGVYDVVVSHGPEFNADFQKLIVTANAETLLTSTLDRVVDTSGWVSTELHSHSSPSGDNTSDQRGRVENLVCEHLEFAPCTEHQRIESYDDQLRILGAEKRMATCTGMELTGSLLPINHQNAFPLKWKPFQQDGGGPRVSGNPETQIARLAMWDDNSKKVVQTNHPNMRQMVFDRDLDGEDDGGFSKMLDFMDVIEVHPPEDIFRDPASFKDQKARDRSRMKPWMDLIKSGRQLPGVVNTDAHYNWHGSGWLRNWVRSETDDPASITVENMIESLESGRIIMSTGPYMTVQLSHADLAAPAEIGDTVALSGQAELHIQVQCPNWLDVNRIGVFVNGEMVPSLSRTRAEHGDAFGDGVVKFDQKLPIEVIPGSFIIVGAIGEKLSLGRVMGEQYGKRPPVVVSNPIYIK